MDPLAMYVDEDEASQPKSTRDEIQAIYDAGTPFFTKDNIRKVGEELQDFQHGERNDGGKVILTGINGVDYEEIVSVPDPDVAGETEHVGGSKWMIAYRSVDILTAGTTAPFFDRQWAYLPMLIFAPIIKLTDLPEYRKPPAPPAEDFSTYQAVEQQWKTSQHYERLQEMLATIEVPFSLTKIIGLALGGLVIKSQVLKRQILQHALISVLHSALVQRGILSVSSKRYVQDPMYTQRSKDVLHSAGLTVLDDPKALLELDKSSVLVCINPDIPVKDIVADICRPGIIIWNRRNYKPHNPRVKDMIENEYSEVSFPAHEGFDDLVVLIRKYP